MAMNSTRFEALFKAQSAAVQKTYAAVPITGAATSRDIHNALIAQGIGHSLSVTEGCLGTLVRAGLVLQPSRGEHYSRTEVRGQKIKLIESEPESKDVPMITPSKKPDPIDQLTQLSAQLRGLADAIEAIALDFTDQLEQIRKESKKLEALRSLLKELA